MVAIAPIVTITTIAPIHTISAPQSGALIVTILVLVLALMFALTMLVIAVAATLTTTLATTTLTIALMLTCLLRGSRLTYLGKGLLQRGHVSHIGIIGHSNRLGVEVTFDILNTFLIGNILLYLIHTTLAMQIYREYHHLFVHFGRNHHHWHQGQ